MRTHRLAASLFLALGCTALAWGQTPAPVPAATPPPGRLRAPNEIGRIPIVMYHSVGERGAYDRHGLNISPATFRRHLDRMLQAGWYPINVRDLFYPERLGAIPAGKTPVALTFDDARGSQFRYRKDGALDPNCAVGILEAFHKKYGARWPQRATFYVLPASAYNPTPFWQKGQEASKLQFLAQAGYEIGNHSTSHHSMAAMDAKRLAWEMATCTRAIRQACPEATMDTMCLPYGVAPRDKRLWKYLLSDGTRASPYRNHAILMAWGDESFAPTDKRFNPQRLPRIGVDPGYFERTLARLMRSHSLYISDGDPAVVSIPRSKEKYLARTRLGAARVVLYGRSGATPDRLAAAPGAGRARPGATGAVQSSVRMP